MMLDWSQLVAAGGITLTAGLALRGVLECLPVLSSRTYRRWKRLLQVPTQRQRSAEGHVLSFLSGLSRGSRGAAAAPALEELITDLTFLLRAGLSPVAALEHAVQDSCGSVSEELARALSHYESGGSLEEALQEFAVRLGVPEGRLVVNTLLIGIRTGGDLPAMLAGCARVLRRRRLLQAELAVQTAEARWSAAIVAAVPLILLAFFVSFQPTFLLPLLRAEWGLYALGYASVSWGLGVFIVWRLTRPQQFEPRGDGW